MLVIRDEQMRALQAYMSKQFENRMVLHVKEFFPEDFMSIGEDKVRTEIKYGIERASSYKITLEYDVCGYINLMFAFGTDYDVDSSLPWAAKILNNEELSGSSKLDRLYEEAEKHR
ncbi:MAG: hypothetical protein ACQ9MH_18350 [Nitrospinales bacterium]